MSTRMDTFYTIVPLNWILRLLSLSNVTRNNNQLISCRSLLKNLASFVIITLSTVLFSFLKFYYHFATKHVSDDFRFIDSIPLVYIIEYIPYVINFFIAYKLKHEKLDYLLFYNRIDLVLEPDLKAIRSCVNRFATCFIVIFVLISSGDFLMWYINSQYRWQIPLLHSMDFVYYFITTMIGLDVVSHVIQIEHRMKVLVKYIEDYYATLQVSDIRDRDAPKVLRSEQLMIVSRRNSGIQVLNKSYLLLMEQVAYINRTFGIRILVLCFNLFINMIHTLNIIIRVFQGTFFTNQMKLPVISTLCRNVGYIGVVMLLVYRCEQTYKQCNAAIRLIDLTLVIEKSCSEKRKALTDLRGLIISRPVRIHAANFFTCDYPLLLSIASAVSTYTIILYQNME